MLYPSQHPYTPHNKVWQKWPLAWLLCHLKLLYYIVLYSLNEIKQGKSEGFDSCDRPSNLTQMGFKSSNFQPVWPWNLIDDPQKLYYITSSFVHHLKPLGEFKLELKSGNAQLGSKLVIFLSCVTLKFDGWPWKTIGHLFYIASSFKHNFIAISEFKLKLQSGNAQFGSKSAIFFVPCDLEIWQMTLKNNRAPLLCYFKLCASFRSHWWIQTGVTVRKRPLSVKIVTSVIGNNSWKFRDDTMTGT